MATYIYANHYGGGGGGGGGKRGRGGGGGGRGFGGRGGGGRGGGGRGRGRGRGNRNRKYNLLIPNHIDFLITYHLSIVHLYFIHQKIKKLPTYFKNKNTICYVQYILLT